MTVNDIPPDWMIEELERSRQKQPERERPFLERPMPPPGYDKAPPVEDKPQRGVVIIPL